MKHKFKSFILTLILVLAAIVPSTSAVFAEEANENVLRQSPAVDAAIIDEMPGFKNYENSSLTGDYTMPEGLVIRQSYVEDGKVYIPPAGLYYTIRISNWNTNPFGDNLQYVMGEKLNWVDFKFDKDVLTDAHYEEVGDGVSFGDGTKTLELTRISRTNPGFVAPVATFQILKPSGNYYGNSFQVSTDDKVMDITEGVLDEGTGHQSGTYEVGEDGFNWNEEYYASSVAAHGASYLVADEISEDNIQVKEFATPALDYILVSREDPVKMHLGVNETAELGDWEVEVLEVKEDTAKVQLTHKESGDTVEKEFAPLNDENIGRIPADPEERHQFMLRPDNDAVQVQLDIYSSPFEEEGKVKLTGYHNVSRYENGQDFWADDRFIFRTDVCSSCNLPVEILIENKETIVLDADQNVFDGIDNYFKVIVEEIDNDKVNAWYIEDQEGNRSENLAAMADGQHIDLLLNTKNRTVSFFVEENAIDIIQRLKQIDLPAEEAKEENDAEKEEDQEESKEEDDSSDIQAPAGDDECLDC